MKYMQQLCSWPNIPYFLQWYFRILKYFDEISEAGKLTYCRHSLQFAQVPRYRLPHVQDIMHGLFCRFFLHNKYMSVLKYTSKCQVKQNFNDDEIAVHNDTHRQYNSNYHFLTIVQTVSHK